MKYFIQFLSIILVSQLPPLISAGEDGIENFLTLAMQKYPSWLWDNNLDPFIDPDFTPSMSFAGGGMQYNLQLWNVAVTNHSQLDKTLITVERSVNSGYVEVNYKIVDSPVLFFGDYNVTGTVWGDSFSGDGKWSVEAGFSSIYNASLHYRFVMNRLEVTPKGFVNTSNADFSTRWFMEPTAHFDGLIGAGEYINEVEESLQGSTLSLLDGWRFSPLQKMIDMYFSKLFEETPVCEMTKVTVELSNV